MHELTTRTTRRVATVIAALLLGTLALAVPASAQAEDGVPPGQAWVRVGHFVPGMGQVSIDLRPQEAGADALPMGGADYAEVSDYSRLDPGTYTAEVRPGPPGTDEEPLLSRTFEVTAGEARTLAVVGTAEESRLVLLSDDLTPPDAGTARVRVLSASETAGPVTVQAAGGPTLADGAVLGQATPYVSVPEGSWTLDLQGEDARATSEDVPIAGGSVYTAVVVDAPGGAVAIEVLTDAAGATVAPRGGAATGKGGTAVPSDSTGAWPGALVALGLGLGAAAYAGSRRPARAAP